MAHHAEQAFGCASVDIEPGIGSLDDGAHDIMNGNLSPNARADFAAKDFNGLHRVTYFDVSIVSPVCDSHKNLTIEKAISNVEKKKNGNYAHFQLISFLRKNFER